MLRFVRDQLYPVAKKSVFDTLALYTTKDEQAVLHEAMMFWLFVMLMDIEEGVHDMVMRTWTGSERMWKMVVWPYMHNRLQDLLESPWDAENADECIVGMWAMVRQEMLPFSVRTMLLQGTLRSTKEPVSRNALRTRKKDIIEERAAAKQGAPPVLLLPPAHASKQ
jgi:hypothetical protein